MAILGREGMRESDRDEGLCDRVRIADIELDLRAIPGADIELKLYRVPNSIYAFVTVHGPLITASLLPREDAWTSRAHCSTANVNRSPGTAAMTLAERLIPNWTSEDLFEDQR